MPKKFDTLRLIPKTRHAKNRIREHGDIVDVIHVKERSFATFAKDGDWRWIDFPEDRDFIWEVL